jgi:hypothetical protein
MQYESLTKLLDTDEIVKPGQKSRSDTAVIRAVATGINFSSLSSDGMAVRE